MRNRLSPKQAERYQRHLQLPEVGEAGQEQFASAAVLVVGAGGLGCPVLSYLAAAGVGRITIIDDDIIELSNLQRQVLYRERDIGNSKALVAAAQIKALNNDIAVVALKERLGIANAGPLIADHDLVIDCTDNFQTRYLLNALCVESGTPWIFGSVEAMRGQYALFNAKPCYQCVFENIPLPNEIPDCNSAGILGVLPGTIGTQQALLALKYLLHRASSPEAADPLVANKTDALLMFHQFDATSMRHQSVAIPANPDCPVCGPAEQRRDIIKQLSDQSDMDPSTAQVDLLTPEQLNLLLDSAEHESVLMQLIDVRPDEHHRAGAILRGGSESKNIPLAQLPKLLTRLDPHCKTVVYCQLGKTSLIAAKLLKDAGFSDVWSLEGGFERWQRTD